MTSVPLPPEFRLRGYPSEIIYDTKKTRNAKFGVIVQMCTIKTLTDLTIFSPAKMSPPVNVCEHRHGLTDGD